MVYMRHLFIMRVQSSWNVQNVKQSMFESRNYLAWPIYYLAGSPILEKGSLQCFRVHLEWSAGFYYLYMV